MIGCPACEAFESNPASGVYAADCLECKARQIARGPFAYMSLSGGDKEPLRQQIYRAFGEAGVKQGARMVLGWTKRLNVGAKA